MKEFSTNLTLQVEDWMGELKSICGLMLTPHLALIEGINIVYYFF